MKTLWVAVATLALAGCTVEEIQTTSPHQVETVAPSRVSGPFAQAGAKFRVKLDDPIGTQLSHPGNTFSATVVDAIVDTQGQVLVPEGAKLSGRIADIEQGVAPKMRLTLLTIGTSKGGDVPIHGRILHAQRMSYPGEPLYTSYAADPSSVGNPWMTYDSVLASPYGGSSTVFTREIEMPVGSEMEIEVTRPLLAPGSRMLP